jgi:sugar lactone lactonase YvrE
MKEPRIHVLQHAPAAQVGESPVWDERRGHLWWVDIRAPALHRTNPADGQTASWPLPEAVGCLALCRSGRAVLLGLKSGIHRFDPASGALEPFARCEGEPPGNRLNDGKASPEGRFLVGSMPDGGGRQSSGALHRLDPDGGCHRLLEGLTVSNGLAWSPDGRTLWHSDSHACRIWTRPYDPATGRVGEPREVARPDEGTGRPDGAAMDAEGGYWSAGVSAGVLNRWLPDGRLDRQVRLPVAAPTMPCFGGEGLRTLFVTSLRRAEAGPLDGRLLALDVGVAGVPVGRFAGA